MTIATSRLLVGRSIVAFDHRKFDGSDPSYTSTDRIVAHDPVLTLDNGARLTFTVEETEVGVYGVRVNYHPKKG